MKIYILHQTNIYKSRVSRVCFGVFDSEVKAIDEAKKNNLYDSESEVVIDEVELNEFKEV